SGESLAGRIAYIEMTTLIPPEVPGDRASIDRLWLRGGFPDSYLASSDQESQAIRKDFIRTYLERDVAMFGPRIPATTLERLWTMLAHSQGGLLNASQLSRALDTSAQSVTRYIDLLCDLLLVRRLTPLHANTRKRLVKSPKVYIRDSGIVHTLLGIETLTQLSGHPVVGMSWEGFVIETLLAQSPWRTSAGFYRSAGGAEVDLILEKAMGQRWAIEIKSGLSAKASRGFYQALEDIEPDRAFVVHAGEDRYPLDEHVDAIGLSALLEELTAWAH
ncbi:MAG: DUF4143 domain-containing protein, partial [Pseudomonadota bacterium]